VKIAVVCSDTGVRVPDSKGASLHLAAITTALARVGNDVLLVAVAGHGAPPGEVASIMVRHPGWSKGIRREVRKLRTVERMARQATSALAAFAPDVVYERLSLFGTAGRRFAAATGARHVLEVNALLAEEEAAWRGLRLAGLARRRERAVLTAADLRVAVSEEVAARISGVVGGRPTAIVPNGVDAAAFASLPEREAARTFLRLPTDRRIVGFAGTLRPWHGLDIAIEAVAELPDVLLAVAGEGELRRDLEHLARERGLADRVRWLGQLPHILVPGFLAALDAAVLPYPPIRGFSFSPLKLYEYLAAGTPVVASNVGQIRVALQEGRLGRLVPPGDSRALARALSEVLAAPETPRAVAAEARRITLSSHSWDDRARRITELMTPERTPALAR
jgi:glycosyltransferase involved in cell wall biosynthesis